MPAETTAPVAPQPNLKPANPIQLNAMAGRSHADIFAESGGAANPEVIPNDAKGFGAELRAAQAKDKGAPATAPETPAPAPAAAEKPAKLSVPDLPQPTQSDEWRPRGEKASQQWDAMKSKHAEEMAAARIRLETMEAELKALKNGGHPEFEMTKKERDQYKEILRDVAIERDPEFQSSFNSRSKSAIDIARMAAGEKGTDLEKLLQAPPSPWREEQINKLVDGLAGSNKRRVEAALTELERIDVERTTEISRRRQTFDAKQSELLSSQKEREQAARQKMSSVFESTAKDWKERFPLLQPKEGDAAHNAQIQETIDLAQHIFNGDLSAEEVARSSFWAAVAPRLAKAHMEVLKELDKVNAIVAKLQGVQPGEGNAGRAEGEENGAPIPAPGSAENLRYFNRGLKQAQMADAQRRGSR